MEIKINTEVKQVMEETITITKREYDDLVNDSIFLKALMSVGVDNWEGYSEAVKLTEEEE